MYSRTHLLWMIAASITAILGWVSYSVSLRRRTRLALEDVARKVRETEEAQRLAEEAQRLAEEAQRLAEIEAAKRRAEEERQALAAKKAAEKRAAMLQRRRRSWWIWGGLVGLLILAALALLLWKYLSFSDITLRDEERPIFEYPWLMASSSSLSSTGDLPITIGQVRNPTFQTVQMHQPLPKIAPLRPPRQTSHVEFVKQGYQHPTSEPWWKLFVTPREVRKVPPPSPSTSSTFARVAQRVPLHNQPPRIQSNWKITRVSQPNVSKTKTRSTDPQREKEMWSIWQENNPTLNKKSTREFDFHGLRVKEAVDRLEDVIDTKCRQGIKDLTVISGRGLHSVGGVPKIKPAFEKYFSDNRIKFRPVHQGGAFDIKLNC